MPGPDLEAVHVYRGHSGPVLALAVPPESLISSGQCGASSVYSAGLDGVIRGWRMPPADPFSGVIDLYSQQTLASEFGPIFKRESIL